MRQTTRQDAGFIARLVVMISAADFAPLTQEFILTAAEQTVVSRELLVPLGPGRRIVVSAFNAFNPPVQIFRGETTVALGQSEQTVSLNLERDQLIPIPATPADLAEQSFAFTNGDLFGLPQASTVMLTFGPFNNDIGSFRIAANGFVASGMATFGSCDLRVESTTFPGDQGPRQGELIRLEPCDIDAVDGRLIVTNVTNEVSRTSQQPINVVNHAPSVANPVTNMVVAEDATDVILNLATIFTDQDIATNADSLTLQVSSNSNPSLVTPTIMGTLLFLRLLPNQNGDALITIQATDIAGTTATTSFLLTVIPMDDAPSSSPPEVILPPVLEDAPATMVALASFFGDVDIATNSDRLTLTVASNSNPELVTPALVGTTLTLTYQPDQHGRALVTVRATDTAGGSAEVSLTITVMEVNDPPSFVKGPDQTVLEDAGPQTIAGWATSLSAGPPDEAAQTLTFVVNTSQPNLFALPPAIGPTGTLTYTPAPHASGSALVTVRLLDSGGIANGGSDASPSQTFTITVTTVNDPPTFVKGPDQTIPEDAGPQIIAGWATSLSAGPPDEAAQTLTFLVTTTNPTLFAIPPALDGRTGTLTYTPAAQTNGTATVMVQLQDTGGTANSGSDTSAPQTLHITVTAINDPPSFVAGPDQTIPEDAGPQTIAGWATSLSAGPPDEAAQTLTFLVTTTNNPLLTTLPAIDGTTGTLTYTPAPNATGSATVTVRLQDSGGTALGGSDTSAPQTFLLTVTAVNDPPTFVKGPDQTVLENAGPQTVPEWATGISPGPADEHGQSLTFQVSTTNPGLFAAVPALSPAGTLTYTPAPHAHGSATVTVQLQDSGGTALGGSDTSAPQTFLLTVTAVNDPPSFVKGSDQTVLEDTGPQTIAGWATSLSAGPPDEAAQTLTFLVTTTNPALFAIPPALDGRTGTLTYTPALNANGSATVTVQLQDSGGTALGGSDTSAPQTFTITVTTVNDPPTFVTGPDQTVLEDAGPQTVTGWATSLSAGPPDEAAQTLTFLVTTTNPTLFAIPPALDGRTGTLTYTPAPNATGSATVTVQLQDSGGTANSGSDTSAPQTFLLTVTAINDPPSFVAGPTQTVLEDAGPQTVTGWATSLSAGPPDEAVQTLTVLVTTDNPALFATLPALDSTTGTLTYTPAPNANGSATVTVQLQDSGGTALGGSNLSAPQTFGITVTAVNDAPSFVTGPDQTVREDAGPQTIAGWATALTPGPPDEAAQTLTFLVFTNNDALFAVRPAITSTGTLTYTPAAQTTGTAIVMVQLRDNGDTALGGRDTSTPQTFLITVAAVNDPPTFVKGPDQTVLEDAGPQTVAEWATDLGHGPLDEDNQTLVFQVSTANPELFLVAPALSPAGTLTYTPAPQANGTATVTVQLQDSGGTAQGGSDTSAPQTFDIAVTAVNDPPTFVTGPDQTVLEDAGPQTVTGWATSLSAGPPDEAAQTLTVLVTADNPALFATLPALDSTTGTLTYTPAPNATGSTTVTVQLQDSGGTALGGSDTSAPQTFGITVTAVNDPPTFVKGPDQTTLEDAGPQTIAGWATALTPGPPDEAAQTLTFLVTTDNPALFATPPALDGATGTLTYTPAPNVTGSATVTVQLQDSGGTALGGSNLSAPQTFGITVTAVNDPPSFVKGPDQTVREDAGPQTIAGWATALTPGPPDEAAQTLTFLVFTNNDALFAVRPAITSTGTLTYTPAAQATGTAIVMVQLQDSGGTAQGGSNLSAAQTFLITVTAVNDPPTFVKGPDQTVLEDAGPQTVPEWATGISPGPADEHGQSLTFQVNTTNPGLFAAVPALSPAGTLTYTPAPQANGSATVTVQLQDSGGTANSGSDTSAPQTFLLTVTAINDPPSFVAGPAQTVLEDAGPQTVTGWATSLSAGPPDEAAQTLTVLVTTDNPALFATLPALDGATGTLTYTPAPNANGSATVTVQLQDSGGTAQGGSDTSAPQTFLLTVTAINDPPSFVAGPAQTVLEDAGPQTVTGWATSLSAGPPDEAVQTLTVLVTTDNPALFATLPALDSTTGTLTYTPAPNANGSATVTVQLQDSGGTALGGSDTSAPQTFGITVTAVNDPPTFVTGPDQALSAGAGAQTVAGWASGISVGPADEHGQTLTIQVTTDNDAFFTTLPTLSSTGTLSYAPSGAIGTTTVTVRFQDDGGTANGGNDTSIQTFTIAVRATLLYGVVPDSSRSGGSDAFYTINPVTGTTTRIGTLGFVQVRGLAFDNVAGTLYATGRRFSDHTPVLLTINPTTGVGREVGPLTGLFSGDEITDISFRHGDNVLYGYLIPARGNDNLITIDPSTGTVTFLGSSCGNSCGPGNGMAFSLSDTLFQADNTFLNILDQQNGSVQQSLALNYPSTPGFEAPQFDALVFDPDTDKLCGVLTDTGVSGQPTFLATIDTETGDVTLLNGALPGGLQALAWLSNLGFDTDRDGLSDANEFAFGTDANAPDTDGDGLTDGDEVITYFTDPRNSDTDYDGDTDGTEVLSHFTNPRDPVLVYSVSTSDDLLRVIDIMNGMTVSSQHVVLSDASVQSLAGLTRHPSTGEFWTLLTVADQSGQQLASINPVTASVTGLFGDQGDKFVALAWDSSGAVLYGLTGDAEDRLLLPKTLYILDTTNAVPPVAPTRLRTLGRGAIGEALTFNQTDSFLYHAAGTASGSDRVFQSIDPFTLAVKDIPLSSDTYEQATALTPLINDLLLLASFEEACPGGVDLLRLTTGGQTTFMSCLDHLPSGLSR